ncbi:MAG: 4-hydroxythreonine-4-phosphate dehydrogenase PdxA [Pseudomonadota bacterium]|nr:4-hydroxythreonine-4-phosphate dehydrogenase PdxA [Pseudomonadota bacterium]
MPPADTGHDDDPAGHAQRPRCPRLALVAGEPAGIGPELCVRLAQQPRDYSLTLFGDGGPLLDAARVLGLPLRLVAADSGVAPDDGIAPGELAHVDIPHPVRARPGAPEAANAGSVIQAMHAAADACLAGAFDGLVTGPVHKAVINDGGIAYTGTTELLARRARCEVVMMLANPTMRVALATTHLPLRAVADAITPESLTRTLRIVHRAMRSDFGIDDPVIAVLGLNPHAGEAGHLGREELDVIEPVIAALQREGMRLVGPLPADTAFLPAQLRGFDAVLAMYHDQGLPVLKFSGFEHAVNLTLGLPYPRVAVDHGTALDLAGTGRADPSSLFAAARTCAAMAAARIAAAGSPPGGD